ncbi:MAG: hypothetical protein ACYTBX_07695 [Planctomycetota bacterium]
MAEDRGRTTDERRATSDEFATDLSDSCHCEACKAGRGNLSFSSRVGLAPP